MQLLVMKTNAIIFLIFALNSDFYVFFLNTKNLGNNCIVRKFEMNFAQKKRSTESMAIQKY